MSEFATSLTAVLGIVFGVPLLLFALPLVYIGGVMRGENAHDAPNFAGAMFVGFVMLIFGTMLLYVGIEAVVVLEARP